MCVFRVSFQFHSGYKSWERGSIVHYICPACTITARTKNYLRCQTCVRYVSADRVPVFPYLGRHYRADITVGKSLEALLEGSLTISPSDALSSAGRTPFEYSGRPNGVYPDAEPSVDAPAVP